MSRVCSVARCKQRCNTNQDDKGNFVSYHKFPNECEIFLREKWIKAIHRNAATFKITKYSRVCSRHFKDSDFTIFDSGRRILKQGTIPSVFDWDTSSDWYAENDLMQINDPVPIAEHTCEDPELLKKYETLFITIGELRSDNEKLHSENEKLLCENRALNLKTNSLQSELDLQKETLKTLETRLALSVDSV